MFMVDPADSSFTTVIPVQTLSKDEINAELTALLGLY